MHIVFLDREREHDLRLELGGPEPTVGDLSAALSASRAGGLVIAGRWFSPEIPLRDTGLVEGAKVAVDGRADRDDTASLELRVVGGLKAGRAHPLPRGRAVVGRQPDCDVVLNHPSVSRRHCEVALARDGTVVVRDLGSHNGTWVDGVRVTEPARLPATAVAKVGDVEFAVAPPKSDDRPVGISGALESGDSATIPFNRPPRMVPGGQPPPLAVPTAPGELHKQPFNVMAMIAPALFGVVLVVVAHNALYGLFALLSPVMALANWYESRFRSRRSLRHDVRNYQEQLDRFSHELAGARAAEVTRRRAAHPDLAEVVRRASAPSVRLWERRKSDPDFMRLSVGLADLRWQVPLEDGRGPLPDEVAAAVRAHETLPLVPAEVMAGPGQFIGIVGPRDASLALARALVGQIAVHHGPADVAVAVLTSERDSWDWAKWLPHVRDPHGAGDSRFLGGTFDESCRVLADIRDGAQDGAGQAVMFAVIDDERLLRGRDAPVKNLLDGAVRPAAGIVLAPVEERLPRACTAVVDMSEGGSATLRLPQLGERVDRFVAGGLDRRAARRCACALARFDDPELDVAGAGLPDMAPLLPLLRLGEPLARAVGDRWRGGGDQPRPTAVIGVAENGPFSVDLVAHGPHGLIGGTTGSGKSELLRTLVAGLATAVPPDHLTFVLIDFKGGSTFLELGDLPHTVGVATDLDAQLAERALRCLQAELRYRERRFQEAEVSALGGYLKRRAGDSPHLEPMPRLVVIIDEFSEMAGALPDFLSSLIGIARRGRSLGVHLILATQKPAGVVNDDIRANTDLKIALRVQDRADSNDVIGAPDAASISKDVKGRAYLRLGPTALVPVQTALAASTTSADTVGDAVTATPFLLGPLGGRELFDAARHQAGDQQTDLSRLIDATRRAFADSGRTPPRRAWLDPLPDEVDLAALAGGEAGDELRIAFALADDPDNQAQYPWAWNASAGNLLLYGTRDSGIADALTSIVLSAAETHRPDDLHVYALDFGAGELAPLTALPHVGAVVGMRDRERQIRLVRLLRAELDRRADQSVASAAPRILAIVNNFAAFTSEFSDLAGFETAEDLARVYADGASVGIHMVLSADRIGGVPGKLAGATNQRLAFRLPDRHDYASLGLSASQIPRLGRARAVAAENGQVLQVATPQRGVTEACAEAARATPAPNRPPVPIGVLPEAVAVGEVGSAQLSAGSCSIPIGVGDRTLGPVTLDLFEGDHAVVIGPGRAGKSTLLAAIAAVLEPCECAVVAIAPRPSPLRQARVDRLVTSDRELGDAIAALPSNGRPAVVLVDDADRIEDASGSLAAVLGSRPDVHVIASGRPEALRPLYGHWTQTARKSRTGVLLRPNVDVDGDLLGVTLPRRQPIAMTPGRGYLVAGGGVELVQTAAASADLGAQVRS